VKEWLTGFNENRLQGFISQKSTSDAFFNKADLKSNDLRSYMWLPT
jgi:hypothetical protein